MGPAPAGGLCPSAGDAAVSAPDPWQVDYQLAGQPRAVRRFPTWGAADRFFTETSDAPGLIFAELTRTRASQGLPEKETSDAA